MPSNDDLSAYTPYSAPDMTQDQLGTLFRMVAEPGATLSEQAPSFLVLLGMEQPGATLRKRKILYQNVSPVVFVLTNMLCLDMQSNVLISTWNSAVFQTRL